MASNVSLMVAVCLLCGFLAVIPPVYSIRCYHKTVYGSLVINDEVVDCKGKDYDKCGTLTFKVDSSSNVLIKNCTRSALDCDEAVVCERERAIFEKHGFTVSDCSSSCCDSDKCNAPVDRERRTAMGMNIKEKLRKLITSLI